MSEERKPNWDKWKHLPEVEVWEAVALSLNVEPRLVKFRSHTWMGGGLPFDESEIFNDRIEIICVNRLNKTYFPTPFHAMQQTYQCTIRLTEFANFSIKCNWEIPDEMLHSLSTAHETLVGAAISDNTVLAGRSSELPSTSSSLGGASIKNVSQKVAAGRPPSIRANAEVIRRLIELMLNGKIVDANNLPGNAEDLLDACSRLEKVTTGKPGIFSTSLPTFNTWLAGTGYAIKVGRPRKNEKKYWTNLVPKIAGKIPQVIFLSINSE